MEREERLRAREFAVERHEHKLISFLYARFASQRNLVICHRVNKESRGREEKTLSPAQIEAENFKGILSSRAISGVDEEQAKGFPCQPGEQFFSILPSMHPR